MQDTLPNDGQIRQILFGQVGRTGCFKRTTLRKVPLEPGGIYLHATNLAGSAKLNGHPVVTRATAPFRFPTVTHIRCPTGHDEIVTMAKKHVAAGEYQRAI